MPADREVQHQEAGGETGRGHRRARIVVGHAGEPERHGGGDADRQQRGNAHPVDALGAQAGADPGPHQRGQLQVGDPAPLEPCVDPLFLGHGSSHT